VAQISDAHVGATWTAVDPLDTLRAVTAAVAALPDAVDAVLVTGDLAADGLDEQYAAIGELLDGLPAPYFVLAGNHDDRPALRRRFPLSGFGDEPIAYEVALPGLRVLMLDTTVPGQGAGALGAGRLDWLARELDAEPDTATLLAMHHPPVLSGIRDTDRYALAADDRVAVAEIVAARPHVCGIVAGHVHRTMVTSVGGAPALTIPSTYGQFALDAEVDRLTPVPGPVGFAVHTLVDGRLISHVQTLTDTA
jgi:3',5'-cyclic AMP phosphodiesterase CpdA